LDQYTPLRARLFAALARVGVTVPDAIVRRANLASCSLTHAGEEPVPQDVLLGLVRETEPASAGIPQPVPSPPAGSELVGLKSVTAADRMRVTNHMERVLASVPEPYPSGPPGEKAAALARWRGAHGEENGDVRGVNAVASLWVEEFSQLAVNLHATLGGWSDPISAADDFSGVARELLERAARVWEAEWRFGRHRRFGNVPEPERAEAAKWAVEDGGWVRETLEHVIYSTPERFEAFKVAVRGVVEAMIRSTSRIQAGYSSDAPAATRERAEPVGTEPGVGAPVCAEGESPGPPNGDPSPDLGASGTPATSPPPFGRLFPDYVHCHGFRDRVAIRFRSLPAPPADYHHGPTLPPRDRLLEWFDALNRFPEWERTAALLDFGGGSVGGFEDLVDLEAWGRSLLRAFIEHPEHAFRVSVLVLDCKPELRLTTPWFGRLAVGADREIPTLDLRTDPGHWALPFEPAEGWEPGNLRPHALDEIDCRRFSEDVARELERSGAASLALDRCVLVFRRSGAHLEPDAVLRRLIDSVWHTMRNVSILHRLTTPLPPRPASTLAPIDRFHTTFDALANWLADTRRLHANFVEPIYEEMRRAVGMPPTPAPDQPASVVPEVPAPPGRQRDFGTETVTTETNAPADVIPPPKSGQSAPPTAFESLLALVKTLRLKGNEADAVTAICDGNGSVPIKNLAVRFEWSNPTDNWNSLRKRLNQKFKRSEWRFSTVDNHATAERLPATGRK
jgi:hypothetical protein